MKYTQFLTFEICRQCNLAEAHKECPSGTANRYGDLDTSKPLNDMQILDAARTAYKELGFAGNIAWHYYNEPMLAWDRMIPLMRTIRVQVPEARFTLWTNGTQLKPGMDGLDLFADVWISNYQHRDWSWVRNVVDRVIVLDGTLDNRLTRPEAKHAAHCRRPYNELIIDYYGNAHLCCMDWQACCDLGNVRLDGFRSVVQAFLGMRARVEQDPMPPIAPRICRVCTGRQHGIVNLVPSVEAATKAARPWRTAITESEE